ncbi:MAG: pilus assembly protein [Alphaproteobacteria bacterium]|nr:pilus assembly protein [Alphaproteobacteria bacterium]
MAKAKPDLLACEAGASTVEMAIVLTAFLGFIFGIINIALVLWTQSSLYYAAEAAARCASVNPSTCSSASTTQTYALNEYFGQPLGGTNPFSYSATGCGHTVSASYTYSLSIPLFPTYSLPLSATACYP